MLHRGGTAKKAKNKERRILKAVGSYCSSCYSLKYGQLRQRLAYAYMKNVIDVTAGDSSIMHKVSLHN